MFRSKSCKKFPFKSKCIEVLLRFEMPHTIFNCYIDLQFLVFMTISNSPNIFNYNLMPTSYTSPSFQTSYVWEDLSL